MALIGERCKYQAFVRDIQLALTNRLRLHDLDKQLDLPMIVETFSLNFNKTSVSYRYLSLICSEI